MKKALKSLMLLFLCLSTLLFAAACGDTDNSDDESDGGEPELPSIQSLVDKAEEALKNSSFKAYISINGSSENEAINKVLETYSSMDTYEIVDGDNFSSYMRLEVGNAYSMSTTTFVDNTYYIYQSASGSKSNKLKCELSENQYAALLEKGIIVKPDHTSDPGLDEFKTHKIELSEEGYVITLTELTDEAQDEIREITSSYVNAGDIEFDEVSAVMIINEDRYESVEMKIKFSVTGNFGEGLETISAELNLKSTYNYSINGLEAPENAHTYVKFLFEDLYGVTEERHYRDTAAGTYIATKTYVQAKTEWRETSEGVGVASFYTQYSPNVGCYVKDVSLTEEEYNSIKLGAQIAIYGFVTDVDGQRAITDAEIRPVYRANQNYNAAKVTQILGEEYIEDYRDTRVYFENLTVVAANDEGAPFLYGADGKGKRGDDIYFKVEYKGEIFNFVFKADLAGADSLYYELMEQLKVGDVRDFEGFLNWHLDEPQPHIYALYADSL